MPKGTKDSVRPTEDGVEVDAHLLARAFRLEPREVPDLMRQGLITSRLERGIDEDEGRRRLVFFYRNSRLTLIVDEAGQVLQDSLVSFGEHANPAALRRR